MKPVVLGIRLMLGVSLQMGRTDIMPLREPPRGLAKEKVRAAQREGAAYASSVGSYTCFTKGARLVCLPHLVFSFRGFRWNMVRKALATKEEFKEQMQQTRLLPAWVTPTEATCNKGC